MPSYIYFYLFLLFNGINPSFSDTDHVLTADTSFTILSPWIDANAVNTILLETPKNLKRSADSNDLPYQEDQLTIRLRIGPSSNVGSVEKYFVINDVYNPKRQTKEKILVPYLVEVKRGEPVIMYSLNYVKDVQYNDPEQVFHNTQKKSQENTNSNDKRDNFENAYKPAVERLNIVMKKLSEMFQQKANEDNKDIENKQVIKEGAPNQKTSITARDYENSVFLKNNENEENIRDSEKLHESESEFQQESSCLKRQVFEDWKKQRAVKKSQKNTKSKKQLKVPSKNKNVVMLNSQTKPSQMTFDGEPIFVEIPQSLKKQLAAQFQQKREKTRYVNKKNFLHSKQDPKNVYRSMRRRFNSRIRKPQNSQLDLNQMQEEIQNENINEKEPIRLIRHDPEPLTSENSENKNYGYENNRKQLYFADDSSTAFDESEHLHASSIQDANENLYFTKKNDYEDTREQLLVAQDKLRTKRSPLESVSRKFYKTELDSDTDRFDNSKVFQDNNLDISACDTCGGKNKKPQKPSRVIINRLASSTQRRAQTAGSKKLSSRNSNAKRETCRCKTHQSACICCSAKRARSSVEPAWYSVFDINVPIPFVSSQIRIFRKRRGLWWEVAPSTNLDSIKRVYSDGNFSFSFSSPIEIVQLEKALRFQDYQVLFPRSAVETRSDKSYSNLSTKRIEEQILNSNAFNSNPSLILTLKKEYGVQKRTFPPLRPITDFGFFPLNANVLQKCPNNEQRLCLNMLTDEAPASTFKVRMPFNDNLLLSQSVIRVQISNIITDATTKDALQISVLVINKGVQCRLVTLSVNGCPTVTDSNLTEAKSCVKKILSPHIAETVSFLLPLIPDVNSRHKKIECRIEVSTRITKDRILRKSDGYVEKVVSTRKFLVEQDKRCLCIYDCSCHCITKLETHEEYKACQKMCKSEKKQAGFLESSAPDDKTIPCTKSTAVAFLKIIMYAAILLLAMLCLGLLKALIGVISPAVDRFGYEIIYPNPNYNSSSKTRRFLGNLFMFTIFPFCFLCTCFTPSAEDLLVASSEWQCCQQQEPTCEDEFDDEDGVFLPQHNKSNKRGSKSKERLVSGIETKQQELNKRLSHLSLAFHQEVSDEENTKPRRLRKSASEIVQTLSERRDQRRRSRQNVPTTDVSTAKQKEAKELVELLLDAKRVYRTLSEPIGNVFKIPHGVKYCIQGYFVATEESTYEFVNFQPLVQYRSISTDNFKTKELHPPIFLSSGAFNRRYFNEMAVLKSGDLTVQPPEGVACINVRIIDDITDTETSSDQKEMNKREQTAALKRYAR